MADERRGRELTTPGREDESPVPDAVGRVLGLLWERLGAETVDRVWIFPPLIRGRKEYGLVAASGLTGDPERRILYTARYSAELSGLGITFDSDVKLEGSAPPDRLPRVMDGVVRRSDLQVGDPREISIEGDRDAFISLARAHGWDGPPDAPGDQTRDSEAEIPKEES
ncbi:MAG: hypothetical protein ACQET1_04115 [Gemmatimonadota bacterium]